MALIVTRKTYEYMTLNMGTALTPLLDQINALGAQGWELVNIPANNICVFKRETGTI